MENIGLIFECPSRNEEDGCPVASVRNMNICDRIKWWKGLSFSEKRELVEHHKECLFKKDINSRKGEKISESLRTKVLPKFNCSNCDSFVEKNKEMFESKDNGYYAMECLNFVHPLVDCVLRGFEGHSMQPGFSQTLNK